MRSSRYSGVGIVHHWRESHKSYNFESIVHSLLPSFNPRVISSVQVEDEDVWRRAFAAMLGVQFILAAAFSIVPPVIPLLLPQLGVVDPRAVSAWSGVLLGVSPLTAGLMAPLWGRVVDRIDRRKIIVMSCLAAGICALLMSVATSAWQLLVLRAAMGFFGGHVVAVMALVTSACPGPRLGWALGWLSTSQLSGMLLGPLIGGVLADALNSYRSPFVAGGCASLMVAWTVLRLPKQAAAAAPSTFGSRAAGVFSQYPQLRAAVLVLLLAQLAMTSAQPIVSLFVHSLVGAAHNLATLAGVAFSVIGISGLLAAPLVGKLGDRFGRESLLTAALCGAALFMFIQAFAATYGAFVIERFLAGVCLAGVIPLTNSLIAHTVSPEDRGRAFGMTGGATFLGAFLGPFSGGIINANFGISRVFELASLALIAGAGVIYYSRKRSRRTPAL